MVNPVNEPMDALTADGFRCDELYRAKVKLVLHEVTRGEIDGQFYDGSIVFTDVEPGEVFYPRPTQHLGVLLSSVFVGKVKPTKTKEQ